MVLHRGIIIQYPYIFYKNITQFYALYDKIVKITMSMSSIINTLFKKRSKLSQHLHINVTINKKVQTDFVIIKPRENIKFKFPIILNIN